MATTEHSSATASDGTRDLHRLDREHIIHPQFSPAADSRIRSRRSRPQARRPRGPAASAAASPAAANSHSGQAPSRSDRVRPLFPAVLL